MDEMRIIIKTVGKGGGGYSQVTDGVMHRGQCGQTTRRKTHKTKTMLCAPIEKAKPKRDWPTRPRPFVVDTNPNVCRAYSVVGGLL
jgi:hypothetical protein